MQGSRASANREDQPRHGTVRHWHVEGLQELRGVPRPSVELTGFEEGGKSRAVKIGKNLRLAFETSSRRIVGPMQHLQRRRPPARVICCAIDLACSATRHESDYAPTPDHGSVGERRPPANRRMAL